MPTSSIPQPVFFNVEYLFSWLWGHILSPILSIQFILFLEFLATIIVIFGIFVIIYSLVRIYEMKQEDKKKADADKKADSAIQIVQDTTHSISNLPGATRGPVARNETWEAIRTKLLSDSPSDWRLGIIEADIYMDRVFDTKGFYGDTVGDKLKNLTPDKFPSVQIAWEAHKVRNRIAHDGADFTLTMPEARRTLSYYEIVFRDLGAIE